MKRALIFPAIVFVSACGSLREAAEDLLDTRTPRERYEATLTGSGLGAYALGRDWLAAGERALHEAPAVTSPHAEEGFLPPSEPTALAYRVTVKRGQQVAFEVVLSGDTSTLLLLDAWQADADSENGYRRVAVADSGRRTLQFTPRRDSEVILRAQPELLRGGRFSASVRLAPTLAFPVHGHGERDIHSVFGDARDGGSRSHHGIDIFAPRGTPVVAAASGVVHRVQTTDIGGHVVWMRDESGNRIYYAHLDRQNVTENTRVDVGDTLGFVGNTGNARTTPPHLHFGVYQRGSGPVDPFWFVHTPRGRVAALTADTARLGELAEAGAAGVVLRSAPDSRADSLTHLTGRTTVRVYAATGGWYRVRLPDGTAGYVTARALITTAPQSVEYAADAPAQLLSRPTHAPTPQEVLGHITPGESVAVVGRFGDYLLVRDSTGAEGWIQQR